MTNVCGRSTSMRWTSSVSRLPCINSNEMKRVALNGIDKEQRSVLFTNVEFSGERGMQKVDGQWNFLCVVLRGVPSWY